jgi:2-C-methyl-D-erythritol 4-phosphate cytidylyltransferase/2-C-methyl-D-erythritol 2,4-cyclodiphosphate synthase
MDAPAQPPEQGETAVVIVAAGRGERAGQSTEGPKQYRSVGGEPVLRRTLRAFASHPLVGRIVVAVHRDDEALFAAASEGLEAFAHAVHGGATRQSSTRIALEALAGGEAPVRVLIHDGVRPFVDADLIGRVISAIGPNEGALPCLAISDTIKRGRADGMIDGTVPRAGLHAAQTPQGFPFEPILTAHRRASEAGIEDFTDDAAIAEWHGMGVRLVTGSPDNVKLTWARDIEIAQARYGGSGAASYPDVRTGNGYDVHAFAAGDHVTLCGVSIDHEAALLGHSDADVGLHALTDALLATCGAGDIGTHFPPTDPQWRGAASRIFVEEAVRIVRRHGGRVANADITLICEAPRIGPHREAMRQVMAAMLGIAIERVSVKATTNEKLGFVGRREGIAAIATASVVYPGEVPA